MSPNRRDHPRSSRKLRFDMTLRGDGVLFMRRALPDGKGVVVFGIVAMRSMVGRGPSCEAVTQLKPRKSARLRAGISCPCSRAAVQVHQK
jgi:hypothetical protein